MMERLSRKLKDSAVVVTIAAFVLAAIFIPAYRLLPTCFGDAPHAARMAEQAPSMSSLQSFAPPNYVLCQNNRDHDLTLTETPCDGSPPITYTIPSYTCWVYGLSSPLPPHSEYRGDPPCAITMCDGDECYLAYDGIPPCDQYLGVVLSVGIDGAFKSWFSSPSTAREYPISGGWQTMYVR